MEPPPPPLGSGGGGSASAVVLLLIYDWGLKQLNCTFSNALASSNGGLRIFRNGVVNHCASVVKNRILSKDPRPHVLKYPACQPQVWILVESALPSQKARAMYAS